MELKKCRAIPYYYIYKNRLQKTARTIILFTPSNGESENESANLHYPHHKF